MTIIVATQQWPFIASAIAYGTVNAYGITKRRPREPRPPRAPRGWMAPRSGGYQPARRRCIVHGVDGCVVLTRDCPAENYPLPRPPAGGGGVAHPRAHPPRRPPISGMDSLPVPPPTIATSSDRYPDYHD